MIGSDRQGSCSQQRCPTIPSDRLKITIPPSPNHSNFFLFEVSLFLLFCTLSYFELCDRASARGTAAFLSNCLINPSSQNASRRRWRRPTNSARRTMRYAKRRIRDCAISSRMPSPKRSTATRTYAPLPWLNRRHGKGELVIRCRRRQWS